ncbi:hypothetical protein EYF80_025612 [Liparis tanakae]|uniref:Uncharacterized protein n=1 Tax=Liparis tanakae TaxID=230148 RepID=A0A4Z2HGS5_9TELE|nr:hypothetical protein EYF80_025612 [Liparis tanakae]
MSTGTGANMRPAGLRGPDERGDVTEGQRQRRHVHWDGGQHEAGRPPRAGRERRRSVALKAAATFSLIIFLRLEGGRAIAKQSFAFFSKCNETLEGVAYGRGTKRRSHGNSTAGDPPHRTSARRSPRSPFGEPNYSVTLSTPLLNQTRTPVVAVISHYDKLKGLASVHPQTPPHPPDSPFCRLKRSRAALPAPAEASSVCKRPRFVNRRAFIGRGEVLHINASPAVSFVVIMTKRGKRDGGMEGGRGDYVRELRWRRYQNINHPASRTRRD